MMQEQSTQVVRPSNPVQGLQAFLGSRTEQLSRWARGRLDPASLVRFALLEYSQSEALRRCTAESIYLALIACAQVGLEPSGVKGEAYIVPFKTTATFMPGYRGLIKLAIRSGQVRAIVAHVVYDRDHFELDLGSDCKVVHRPALRDRGTIIGAYALAKMANGEIEVEWMSLEDLERVRRVAQKGGRESPAYTDWADQMYRKAPIRRLCKRLPMGDDYHLAARLDEMNEVGDVRGYRQALEVGGGDMPILPAEPEDAPAALPAAQPQVIAPPPAPTRGAAGAKQQLQKQKAAARPTEPPAPAPTTAPSSVPDELERRVIGIEESLAHATERPETLPKIRAAIEALPEGADQERLLELLARAEVAAEEG